MRIIRCICHPDTGLPELDGPKRSLTDAEARKFGVQRNCEYINAVAIIWPARPQIRQGWIEVVPGVAPHCVGDCLRLQSRSVSRRRRIRRRGSRSCVFSRQSNAIALRRRQCSSPAMSTALWTTFGQPPLMKLNAESFFGVMNPECTRRRRVSLPTEVRVEVTTVSRRTRRLPRRRRAMHRRGVHS